MEKNLYEVLGLDRGASADDVKKAFRRLASQLHPDKNPGDAQAEASFKLVNEAHQVLSDDARRAAYDFQLAFGAHGVPPGARGPGQGRRGQAVDFSQVMEDLFRGQGGFRSSSARPTPQQPQQGTWQPQHDVPGEDVHVEVDLTFEESIRGCKKAIKARGHRQTVPCPSCGGSGSQPGSRTVTCSACAGHGRGVSPTGSGASVRKCAACRGRGSVPLAPCRQCAGRGTGAYEKDVTVTVPAGVDTGQQLRLPGMGTPGHPPGDLYVSIRVESGGSYRREGMDVHCVVRVTMKHAILGGRTVFDGPDGSPVELDVPPGSQPGDVVTVPGAGVVGALSKTRGDLKVHVDVSLPKKLSPRGKKLLEELYDEMSRTQVG